jgi:hypothetical protein
MLRDMVGMSGVEGDCPWREVAGMAIPEAWGTGGWVMEAADMDMAVVLGLEVHMVGMDIAVEVGKETRWEEEEDIAYTIIGLCKHSESILFQKLVHTTRRL